MTDYPKHPHTGEALKFKATSSNPASETAVAVHSYTAKGEVIGFFATKEAADAWSDYYNAIPDRDVQPEKPVDKVTEKAPVKTAIKEEGAD